MVKFKQHFPLGSSDSFSLQSPNVGFFRMVNPHSFVVGLHPFGIAVEQNNPFPILVRLCA